MCVCLCCPPDDLVSSFNPEPQTKRVPFVVLSHRLIAASEHSILAKKKRGRGVSMHPAAKAVS